MSILIRPVSKSISTFLFWVFIFATNLTQAAVNEAELKSAYIINIINYVEWPQTKQTKQKNLCVFVENPFENYLEKFAQHSRLKRNISVEISYPKELEALSSCHIIYISKSSESELKEVLSIAEANSILTISDIEQFAENKGMIEFVSKKKRIKLHINIESTNAAQLKMSYLLLELAEKIIKLKVALKHD